MDEWGSDIAHPEVWCLIAPDEDPGGVNRMWREKGERR